MALQKQAIAGTAIGIVVGLATALLIYSRPPKYKCMKIDGDKLRALYSSANFSRIVFNFKVNSSREFELQSQVYGSDGSEIPTPSGLLTVLSESVQISGDRNLGSFPLEHQRVASLLQLKTLVDFAAANPGCHFVCKPGDYVIIDPLQKDKVYYKLAPFRGSTALDPGNTDARAFNLNPSPPGRRW